MHFPIIYFVVSLSQYAIASSLFLSFCWLTFNALFISYALPSSLENGHSYSDVNCVSVLPLGIGTVTHCVLGIIITATAIGLKP